MKQHHKINDHFQLSRVQVNNYEIVVKFFHISLTWYSEIVQRFTRISKFCSTYELTKQFMEICVKNCAINLKKNNLYQIVSTLPIRYHEKVFVTTIPILIPYVWSQNFRSSECLKLHISYRKYFDTLICKIRLLNCKKGHLGQMVRLAFDVESSHFLTMHQNLCVAWPIKTKALLKTSWLLRSTRVHPW